MMDDDHSYDQATKIREKILFQKRVAVFGSLAVVTILFLLLSWLFFSMIGGESTTRNDESIIAEQVDTPQLGDDSDTNQIPLRPLPVAQNPPVAPIRTVETSSVTAVDNASISTSVSQNQPSKQPVIPPTIPVNTNTQPKPPVSVKPPTISPDDRPIQGDSADPNDDEIISLLREVYAGKKVDTLPAGLKLRSVNQVVMAALIFEKSGHGKRAREILIKARSKYENSDLLKLYLSRLLISASIDDDHPQTEFPAETLAILSTFGENLRGEPAFLKRIAEKSLFEQKTPKIFENQYGLFEQSGNTLFFTVKSVAVHEAAGRIEALKWDGSRKILIYGLENVGSVVWHPERNRKKFYQDVVEIDLSKRGLLSLQQTGLMNEKNQLEGIGALQELSSRLTGREKEIRKFRLSPDQHFIATYSAKGVMQLLDTTTGMARYKFDHHFSLPTDIIPFCWNEERSLYYLYIRDESITSLTSLDLNRFEEKRVFSTRSAGVEWLAVDLLPRKFLLLSHVASGKNQPEILIMEHFGRNPVSIQENAAFPCLMDDGSGFYFSRDNQIFRGEFVPVSLDELRTLLQAVTPNYARKISIKIPTLQETEQLKNSLEMVHNEYEIFQAGLIFYEAKLLEELNLLELAQQTYKKVANYPSCDVYQEATEAALEKLEILMNREQK